MNDSNKSAPAAKIINLSSYGSVIGIILVLAVSTDRQQFMRIQNIVGKYELRTR